MAWQQSSSDEERRLVIAAQRGDVESFNQLVRSYQQRVYNLCLRMLGDAEAAADTAQDTFIAAYRSLSSFRGGQLRSWLLRIAANLCYDQLRLRQRRRVVSLDAAREPDDDRPGLELPDRGEALDERALRHELSAAIARGLAELPAEQRLVLVLCDVQGLAYDEIAQVTGMQMGTVKSRISRARARLREILRAGDALPQRYRAGEPEPLGAMAAC